MNVTVINFQTFENILPDLETFLTNSIETIRHSFPKISRNIRKFKRLIQNKISNPFHSFDSSTYIPRDPSVTDKQTAFQTRPHFFHCRHRKVRYLIYYKGQLKHHNCEKMVNDIITSMYTLLSSSVLLMMLF